MKLMLIRIILLLKSVNPSLVKREREREQALSHERTLAQTSIPVSIVITRARHVVDMFKESQICIV